MLNGKIRHEKIYPKNMSSLIKGSLNFTDFLYMNYPGNYPHVGDLFVFYSSHSDMVNQIG